MPTRNSNQTIRTLAPLNADSLLKRYSRMVALGCFCAGLLGLAGCATTDNSDLPWNTPATWEGTVGVPGMSTGGF
jgi:hypothetical protein